MILYRSTSGEFLRSIQDNSIVDRIEMEFERRLLRRPGPGEKRAWNNSMQFMGNIVRGSEIPDNCGVLIEFNIPSTSKRIDFILSGHDHQDRANFLIIELKQWEKAEATDKEAVVRTFVGKGLHEVAHPAYQADSYRNFLLNMNEEVASGRVTALSCAYLHNYTRRDPEPLLLPRYQDLMRRTPLFFKSDALALQKFAKGHLSSGYGMEILDRVGNSRIAPSRKLIEAVDDMFKGNEVYTLLDEQKVALSSIMSLAHQVLQNSGTKRAIVVDGGPGTGKSVVAVSALVQLLREGLNVRLVAPNGAFRTSLVDTLAQHRISSKNQLRTIFTGSASYLDAPQNQFDVLIVDEAHRLKGRGAYQYVGESQVEDIIKTARASIFFIDDEQRVRPDDEGSVQRIEAACRKFGASLERVPLKAQFRCSGAEGFVSWLRQALQIEDGANFDGWEGDFEFIVFDDPNEMLAKIRQREAEGKTARMVAGYAWPWTSEGNDNGEVADVSIPEKNFALPWNSRSNSYAWAIDPSMRNQVGCVHTCQGLEFDYVGVIIGLDLRYDPKSRQIYGDWSDYYDRTGKKGLKDSPEELTRFIKQIYRILMSRGIKGCYLYCRDKALQEYFREWSDRLSSS